MSDNKAVVIYSRLVAVLGEMFPNKTRIPYAYSLPDNNKNLYVDGYGLTIGEANFEPFEFCGFTMIKQVSVIFAREVKRISSDAEPVDNVIKSLMKDIYAVQQRFYNYNELEIESSIAKVDITSTSAPTELITDKQSFLYMTANFNFWINELIEE